MCSGQWKMENRGVRGASIIGKEVEKEEGHERREVYG